MRVRVWWWLHLHIGEPLQFWSCCLRAMLHHRLKHHSVEFVIDYAYMRCREDGCEARWDWMWVPKPSREGY